MASLGDTDTDLDALVIGAGFSGLYALYKLRELGHRVRVLDTADAVGGTWYWNRYPGARVDIESIEYSYSFSEEIQREWVWSDLMPAQPEIEAYLNFVADRLELRRDIQLSTTVTSMTFDEDRSRWVVGTDRGERFDARFVVAATGLLSVPLAPEIPGRDTFAGPALYTSRFPQEGFDFSGKRVAVIGTGSSGVQVTPVIADDAEHLYVFQRSGAYTFPSSARPFGPGEFEDLVAQYPQIRADQRDSPTGMKRTGAFAWVGEAMTRPPIRTATREEKLRAIEERGRFGAVLWSDIFTDYEASQMAAELYGEAIARIVEDPETAACLVPNYPFLCKRPIIDSGYYETFNRDNVTLVDLRKGRIREITPSGIETEQGSYEVDVIVYATGFDALTGALTRIDVHGCGGVLLRDVWRDEGPVSYLGLQVAGFPNLFVMIGPGSPGALVNVVMSLELQVDWIARCITHLDENGYRTIDADPAAQAEWTAHVHEIVSPTLSLHPSCTSWWIGANVPGKKRMYMSYAAGLPNYRQRCDDAAAAGYAGFRLE